MTSATVLLDRAATLVIAVVLIVGGAAALIWNTTLLDRTPDVVTAPGLVTASTTAWWPWAVTGIGIVLTVFALRWLIAHRPAARVGRIVLPATDSAPGTEQTAAGRSTSDVGVVAAAAARALATDPSISSATGKAVLDRRRRTLDITATAAAPDLLADAIRAADRIAHQAITVLGDNTLAARTLIRIDTSRNLD